MQPSYPLTTTWCSAISGDSAVDAINRLHVAADAILMLCLLRNTRRILRDLSPISVKAGPFDTKNRSFRFIMSAATTENKPIEVLLVGLGSIGSVYAHILEKVSCMTGSCEHKAQS